MGPGAFPEARPRIISDNGPQFIARDFKEFIRVSGITHVWTSPFYPQSNGKLERWHGTMKRECVRPAAPATLDEARRRIGTYVEHYNTGRLHSALGYVTPMDKLMGLDTEIFAERDRKLEAARELRRRNRASAEPSVEGAERSAEGAERSVEHIAGQTLVANSGVVDVA